MKYNYSDELKSVFRVLQEVQRSREYANLPDEADDPGVRDFLRNVYLNNLRFDLIALYRALSKWVAVCVPMERKSNDENN